MDKISKLSIRLARWPEEQEALRLVRESVFVREQNVPSDMEWDDQDSEALHFLVLDPEGNAIATARLLPSGQLGRMAVLKPWRNQGLGTKLLTTVLTHAQAKRLNVFCHAQVQAIDFYRRAGFIVHGEPYMEAGIQHQTMLYVRP